MNYELCVASRENFSIQPSQSQVNRSALQFFRISLPVGRQGGTIYAVRQEYEFLNREKEFMNFNFGISNRNSAFVTLN